MRIIGPFFLRFFFIPPRTFNCQLENVKSQKGYTFYLVKYNRVCRAAPDLAGCIDYLYFLASQAAPLLLLLLPLAAPQLASFDQLRQSWLGWVGLVQSCTQSCTTNLEWLPWSYSCNFPEVGILRTCGVFLTC